MRWVSLITKIPYLIRTLPLNRNEIIKFSAKIKDIFLNPTESSLQFISAILVKQNYVLKRVTAAVLLFSALILGADIGIDYERKQIDPTLFEPKILTAPLDRPEDRVESVPNPLPETKTSKEIEQEPELIVPLIDPVPPEYMKELRKRNFKRPSSRGRREKQNKTIYEPFTLNSSGVNGY